MNKFEKSREQKWNNNKFAKIKDVNKDLIGNQVLVFYKKEWKLATVSNTASNTIVFVTIGKSEKAFHFTDIKFI